MRRSIRWRLQTWYALVLYAVVVSFAVILYFRLRQATLQEVDAGLEAEARYLEALLRRFPPHELDGFAPRERPPHGPHEENAFAPPPPRHWEEKNLPRHRHPPPPGRERLLEELALPGHSGPPRAPGYFGIWRSDGSVVKTSDLPRETNADDLSAGLSHRPLLMQLGPYREAALAGPGGTRILVGRSIDHELGQLRALAWQLLGVGVAVLAVGLAGGWVVSARIFQPVAAIAATASAISARNLSQRIDPATVDRELTDLALVLNAMFDRLEAAFERQARFTGDASHELRTPLTILRTQAELALARPRSAEEYREALAASLRAAGRMSALVDGLLTLARVDAGRLDLQGRPVDLKLVVEETLGLFRGLADARGQTLTAMLGPAIVAGDAQRLSQVVTNLLNNAIQYNRPGGEVRVELRCDAGEVVLAVSDTGCGIPEEDRPHIFERFYRVDKARTRASGGNGLGLAICKSIVDAHAGTIAFTSAVDCGTTFVVRLPAFRSATSSATRVDERFVPDAVQ